MDFSHITNAIKNTTKYVLNNPEAISCNKSFKTEYSDKQRRAFVKNFNKMYPDEIPIILEKDIRANIPEIPKKKCKMNKSCNVSHILAYLHKNIKLDQKLSIYISMDNGHVPKTSENIFDLYEKHKSADGILYVIYYVLESYG